MEHTITVKGPVKKKIERLSPVFYGKDPSGNELGFTNYYMEINGKPFFAISGECHYSRVSEEQWEDSILKMKMGGINIVSIYIFWNHHEEEEGVFRFDGNRNVRKFLELCGKHGMYAIIRIGPFDHGEVRNGGLPDWLYGKPFEVRSNNPGFMGYTRRLYHQLAKQFEGLYYKDGGPVIGTQIENEYMHSAAPWEMTTGVTNEWIPGGSDGVEYMKELKKIAMEEGIITPFYTCTGWGGAAAPTDEMIPLWGGYAFWPWIFYDYSGEHPVTPEYIYRDYHNNDVPETYNFKPTYEPESLPYACCEMGGGMACFYNYRFQLPYESVDAMANIKLAGGCNFLGYYMYRGGTNPKGVKSPYLNECQCPKLSYDFQAAIGEYGQLRPSYYRLKALHMLVKNFEETFCRMVTVLPEGSQEIEPADVKPLRYAVRTNGAEGFLFLNNYQDHVECSPKKGETVTVKLPEKEITFPDISLAAGEEAVLPFEMDVEGYRLNYARVQPLSMIREEKRSICFFFMPEGMEPVYVWDGGNIESVDGRKTEKTAVTVTPASDKMSSYTLRGGDREVEIVTLTRQQSFMFYETEVKGRKTAILCDGPFFSDGTCFHIESTSDQEETMLLVYPSCELEEVNAVPGIFETQPSEFGEWKGLKLCWNSDRLKAQSLDIMQCGPYRYVTHIPEEYGECKDALMQVEYTGDIGHAFMDGELVADNFCNQATWEIGLKEALKPGMGTEMTFLITPLKKSVKVDVSSTMAGRMEKTEDSLGGLRSVRIQPVLEAVFKIKE